jgi:ribonuclease E
MTKRLLIDASHAEETRVVVLDGNRLEDFDVETLSRRQLKGNIYLAKVVRVEPSLQAAFVEYGGNRHGFLAFAEIHPDYYQIPVADRQRLIALQEEEARAEEEAEDDDIAYTPRAEARVIEHDGGQAASADDAADAAEGQRDTQPMLMARDTLEGDIPAETEAESSSEFAEAQAYPLAAEAQADPVSAEAQANPAPHEATLAEPGEEPTSADLAPTTADEADAQVSQSEDSNTDPSTANGTDPASQDGLVSEHGTRVRQIAAEPNQAPELLGGETDTGEETRQPRQPPRFMRNYKIQEVIRRRQILLIQVVKEERGTKGAALTTYISLAGRYCVLMPNSPRGGGISRKITSAADRRRLKEITAELEIPRGMGLIVRTAGAARPKAEIKRDGEYLLRLWDDIREQTMASMAPALIHEEASLIKRAIRDVYSRDVDELIVDGEDGWRAARDYMRLLMPTHVKKVQLWPANAQPLFAHSQVESMLDAMLNPTVQLRSGGYLVINQTEALVAIDVNSGRSTRERGIEETALRTNLEAAEEAARQLRLRDLAGLIVIDFIDMESKKHNAMVERRMADALKTDRARIQIGHISHFGLLELSRQRLRPSLAETSLTICPQCGGAGHVRSTESAALHVLREIEEEGGKRRAAEILVHVATATALYILNNKRQRLTEIEARYTMRVAFAPDDTLLPAQTRIDRLRAALPQEAPPTTYLPQPMPAEDASEADIADEEEDVVLQPQEAAAPAGDYTTDPDHVPGETAAEGEQRRRRRRRRRRGGRREDAASGDQTQGVLQSVPNAAPMMGDDQPDIPDVAFPFQIVAEVPIVAEAPVIDPAEEAPEAAETPEPALEADGEPTRAKRGRRGGRRRRKPGEDAETPLLDAEVAPAPVPAYTPPAYVPYVGPTPADPFGGAAMDIFDVLEQAEQRAEAAPAPAEPVVGPAIQPVVIGETPVVAQPKRGWWRRG